MQGWLVVGAWVFAVLFAVVLLGFAAYELTWKGRRLAADRAKLERTVQQLNEVAGQLQAAADRASALDPAAALRPSAGLTAPVSAAVDPAPTR